MPKARPKYDDPESKRFLEIAREHSPIPREEFDRAMDKVAKALPAAAKPKPKRPK